MADHGGQPKLGSGDLAFDVTDLKVTRETGDEPYNILKPNTRFRLTATFTGHGSDWRNLKTHAAFYEATFYAEGIGDIGEFTLGTEHGNLNPGDDLYEVEFDVPNTAINDEGIYRFGVVVNFPPDPNIAGDPGWLGWVGYYEGLLVQANEMA